MNFIFMLWALVVGFGIGILVSRQWISVPLWEIEEGLRRELGEARKALLAKDWLLNSLRQDLIKHSVVCAIGAGPTIAHRNPSDVFFLEVEDLLR